MWGFFTAELDLQRKEQTVTDVSERVTSCLRQIFAGGSPLIDQVAAQLCMIVRTLQRQFQKEGTSF